MDIQDQTTLLASQVKGIILDVDGVLTNGQINYSDSGEEIKSFHVQDGASIKLLQNHEIEVAIISGRTSPAVTRRAQELGIKYVQQSAQSKSQALDELLEAGFCKNNLCAIGDDLADLELYARKNVTLKVTVANGHPAVQARADFVTQRKGGEGVIVELAQLILKAQGRWNFE
ncbi:MAG: KdsC family phosphatase [Candidatus Azotimanducaceae bacterium]|jgi:3-deoxy-D-manno-octulosonate 8-phosphate phosphatase (KDO 8-P phosphatase)|tara:strand:+ start:22 stop:540 length:519 start_codon:yes stop_codon:yes gene_type:complete